MDLVLKTPRRKSKWRRLIVALFVVVCLPVLFVWLVNQHWLVLHTLRIVNFTSPTQIALSRFYWNPLKNTVEFEGLGIHHKEHGHDAWMEYVSLHYHPLGLLRGKFVVDRMDVRDARLIVSPMEPHPRGSLNITRLLLLQSLIIESAHLEKLTIAFGGDATLRIPTLDWSLDPKFTGDTTLALAADEVTLHKANNPLLSARTVTLKASTLLSRWKPDFPYLNALHGTVAVDGLIVRELPIDNVQAVLDYEDERIKLSDLIINKGGNDLRGALDADMSTQKFSVSIHIAKPIALPYLGVPLVSVNTAGDLVCNLVAEGQGLDPATSYGKGAFALTHRFAQSPEAPVSVAGNINWASGALHINDGRVTVSGATFTGDGTIDFARKHMAFSGEGQKFPVEAVFDKFTNPYLQRIHGASDAKGTIEGWGRDFIAKVTGRTYNGGFKPIVGEVIDTELEATYNNLSFAWKLSQAGRQTGTASLSVAMGPKTGEALRAKTIDLVAKLDGHDLAPSLPEFSVTGTGSGDVALKGPLTSFTGAAKVTIAHGSWLKLPLNAISSDIDISRHQIVFKNARVTPASFREMPLIEPLVMDFPAGRFRLHGTPFEGTNIDLTYTYASKTAQIERISYEPSDHPGDRIVAKGSVTSGGGINLGITGNFDLSIIEPLGMLVREASGPAQMNLRIGGTTAAPGISGTMTVSNAVLSPRTVRLAMEDLNGTLRFEGHRIYFDQFTGSVEDGGFTLAGWLEHDNFTPTASNLTLDGKGLSFRTTNNSFRMEFDGHLALTGAFPHPLLAGDISIIDGRYTKDFTLIEQLTAGGRREEEASAVPSFDPRLDLRISNAGDLMISNNVGEIDLRADITLHGTRLHPEVTGAIDVREGRIDYLGLKFDITRGIVEFREPYAKTYLEIYAERELRTYNLNLRLYGPTDNLMLDLEGNSLSGPLEKRDIVSLLAFGITEQERRTTTDAQLKGSKFGVSMAAAQVGQLLERPITEATHLDIFRIESEEPEATDEPGKVATRLKIGKQLTDRLSVNFATDIDTKDSEQTVSTEYLVTDNVLLRDSRSSNSNYRISGGLRFRLR